MTDVVDRIEHDHRAVEALFAQFESSHDRAVADKICGELEIHTMAEEKAVYPVMRAELSRGEEEIDEAEHEHAEAKQLIGRIRRTEDSQQLAALMTELEGAIQTHVREEETEMLPKARKELPAEELEELGDKFETAKDPPT